MKPKYNPAGKSTREMAGRRRRTAIIIGLAALGAMLVIGFFVFNSKALGITGGAYLAIILAVFFISELLKAYAKRSSKMEKRAIRGAQAEEAVGSLLESLGPDYFILHDVASPYGNIDHVVIGRQNGILLIETKSHHGKVDVSGEAVLVNGKPPEKNFIGQVLGNTFWLNEKVAEVADVHPRITPVLVFTNAFVPYGKSVKNVRIINKRSLEGTVRQNSYAGEEHKFVWEMRAKIAEELSKAG